MSKFVWPKWMGEEPRRNAPWTHEEDKHAVQAFKAHEYLVDIAQVHGRTVGGIVSRLRLLLGDDEFSSIQIGRLGTRGRYLGATLPHELIDAEIMTSNSFIAKYGRQSPAENDVRRTIAKIREDLNRLERSLDDHC